ncbi:MAG: hypothetical protein ACM35G_01565 [Planctomycetaceae bacterium]
MSRGAILIYEYGGRLYHELYLETVYGSPARASRAAWRRYRYLAAEGFDVDEPLGAEAPVA